MEKQILVIPGDGIGKEVTPWGRKILELVAADFDVVFNFDTADMGHEAIVKYGTPLPDHTLEKAAEADAILFGAIGHATYDNDPTLKVRPEQGLLKLRKQLGLFANLRPITLFDELLDASSLKPDVLKGTDILFFRELTGDVYFGEKKRSADNREASDLMVYTVEEVERIAHMAFAAARRRKRRLTSVDKANVLESSRLWRETVQRVATEYNDVTTSHMFVDNAAMQLIKNPRQFDVILTGNLFGDILTDEASQIAGSMGLLASASIGNRVGFYEPIHGSAHDIAGKGIANPLASILSAALLLEHSCNLGDAARKVHAAVGAALAKGYRTRDIACDATREHLVCTTAEMGEQVLREYNLLN